MADSISSDGHRRPRAFEWWMLSGIGTGMAMSAFLSLLLPPFVTDVTGSATRVGVVFAVISLVPVAGPYLGKLAERSGRYRLLYMLSMLLMAVAFALLAIDEVLAWYSPLFGILIGAAIAVHGTIGPAFIVGSGADQATVARRMTIYNLTSPVGGLIGAFVIVGATAAGMTTLGMFWLAAALLLVIALATWPALRAPASRLRKAHRLQHPSSAAAAKPGARGLGAAFTAFLAVTALAGLGSSGIGSQLSNIMPAVYGFSALQTALAFGVAGLVNLGVIGLSGLWMAKRGPLSLYVWGSVLRGAGPLLMVLVALFAPSMLLLAALAMIITYQTLTLPRLAANPIAMQVSPTGAAQANGYLFAASSVGSVIGCLAAGLLADVASFEAVLWFSAIAGLVAGGLAMFWFVPVAKRRLAEHSDA